MAFSTPASHAGDCFSLDIISAVAASSPIAVSISSGEIPLASELPEEIDKPFLGIHMRSSRSATTATVVRHCDPRATVDQVCLGEIAWLYLAMLSVRGDEALEPIVFCVTVHHSSAFAGTRSAFASALIVLREGSWRPASSRIT